MGGIGRHACKKRVRQYVNGETDKNSIPQFQEMNGQSVQRMKGELQVSGKIL